MGAHLWLLSYKVGELWRESQRQAGGVGETPGDPCRAQFAVSLTFPVPGWF